MATTARATASRKDSFMTDHGSTLARTSRAFRARGRPAGRDVVVAGAASRTGGMVAVG
jgi:hypothetical protein